MTVEDAISGQYSSAIASFAKPTFERFRRTRHAAQYFDPSVPEISEDDAHWALSTAHRVVDAVREVLATDAPPLFSSG